MKGTMDFVALNYYSASYVSNAPGTYPGNYIASGSKNGVPLGPISGTSWQTVYAPGLRLVLSYVAKAFNMDIMVTECGTSVPGEANMTIAQVTNDVFREDFFTSHLKQLSDSILIDKLPIKAFLAWSLFDNFEWNTYDQRFGVIGINFNGNLTRTMKGTATTVSSFFKDSVSGFKLPLTTTTSSNDAKNGAVETGVNDLLMGLLIFMF